MKGILAKSKTRLWDDDVVSTSQVAILTGVRSRGKHFHFFFFPKTDVCHLIADHILPLCTFDHTLITYTYNLTSVSVRFFLIHNKQTNRVSFVHAMFSVVFYFLLLNPLFQEDNFIFVCLFLLFINKYHLLWFTEDYYLYFMQIFCLFLNINAL